MSAGGATGGGEPAAGGACASARSGDALPARAQELAEVRLAPLTRRLTHVRGVARAAAAIAAHLEPECGPILVASAWLHDVGYAPSVIRTGFHPLDGALFLRDAGFPELIVSLVAHHSQSMYEARERGVDRALECFAAPPADLLDALTLADLTTSPDGEPIDPRARVAGMLERYPSDDPVHRAVLQARADLLAVAERAARAFAPVR